MPRGCATCAGSGAICIKCGSPSPQCSCPPQLKQIDVCEGCGGEGVLMDPSFLEIDQANEELGDLDADLEIDLA